MERNDCEVRITIQQVAIDEIAHDYSFRRERLSVFNTKMFSSSALNRSIMVCCVNPHPLYKRI